jgi:hypothetical protein
MHADNKTWTVTRVYVPQEDNEKEIFLDEILGFIFFSSFFS